MNVSLSYTLALAVGAALTFAGRTSPVGDTLTPEAALPRIPQVSGSQQVAGPSSQQTEVRGSQQTQVPSLRQVEVLSAQQASVLSSQQDLRGVLQADGSLGVAPERAALLGAQSASGARSAGGQVAGRCGSALVGSVHVTRRGDTVRLFLNVLNAPPGEHAVRFHQTGDCSAFDAASASAVWSPHGSALGGEGQLGNLGDMHVDDSGRGRLAFSASAWALGNGSETDLVGRALVIHERSSEQLGGAGLDLRIGCAVIR